MTRIVIKIGTNALTNEQGEIDEQFIQDLTEQIMSIKKQKVDVLLVSSGAVGAGKKLYKQHHKKLASNDKVVRRQVYASLGQIDLLNTYLQCFLQHNYFCAQILATKEDFRDRRHFLNMRNCLDSLLSSHIVPILNENDTISIDELMFSDNDELAGLVCSMMGAEKLIILTDVDGLFDGDPTQEGTSLIKEVEEEKNCCHFIADKKSSFGRGGMATKCDVARKMSKLGIETIFANAKRKGILTDIMQGDFVGTRFLPAKKASSMKKWIAVAPQARASVVVNQNAEKALVNNIASLLPVGIVALEGDFDKGDTVEIKNEAGQVFAVGMVRCSAAEASAVIGKNNQAPLIHRNYLFLH